MKQREGKKTSTVIVRDLKELASFAKSFSATLKGGEVVALSGPLGAGKTAFVQELGKALGVRERITSPTFTLMHVHRTASRQSRVASRPGTRNQAPGTRLTRLVHIDAYRLSGAKALTGIGALDEFGRKDTVVLIEWAAKVRRAIPKDAIWIDIVPQKDGSRLITVGSR